MVNRNHSSMSGSMSDRPVANTNNTPVPDSTSNQQMDNEQPGQNQETVERCYERLRQKETQIESFELINKYSALTDEVQAENAALREQILTYKTDQSDLVAQNDLLQLQIKDIKRKSMNTIRIRKRLVVQGSRNLIEIDQLRRNLSFVIAQRDREVGLREEDRLEHEAKFEDLKEEAEYNNEAVQNIVEQGNLRRDGHEREIRDLKATIDQQKMMINDADRAHRKLRERNQELEAKAGRRCDAKYGTNREHSKMLKTIRDQDQNIKAMETTICQQSRTIENEDSINVQHQKARAALERRLDSLPDVIESESAQNQPQHENSAEIEELKQRIDNLQNCNDRLADFHTQSEKKNRQLHHHARKLALKIINRDAHITGLEDRIAALESEPELPHNMEVLLERRVHQEISNAERRLHEQDAELQGFRQHAPALREEIHRFAQQVDLLQRVIWEYQQEVRPEEYLDWEVGGEGGNEGEEFPQDPDISALLELMQQQYGAIVDRGVLRASTGNQIPTRHFVVQATVTVPRENNLEVFEDRPRITRTTNIQLRERPLINFR